MSDIMLFGVLEMPPDLWHSDPIDIAQRHGRYKQAAQRIRDDEEKIAAKDAEIAEAGATIADMANTILRLNRERNEARECVRRLWRALEAVRGAGMETCMVERDGHDDQIEAVTVALEVLASTPEHLR